MWLAANPSVTDWIQAGSSLALIAVAVLGFLATIHTITQARNRQALEIEGYIRVDVGPPQPTADYEPPEALRFVQTDKLRVLGEAPDDAPTISVFYRNLQQHPLGIAHGVRGVVVAEVRPKTATSSRSRLIIRLPTSNPVAAFESTWSASRVIGARMPA